MCRVGSGEWGVGRVRERREGRGERGDGRRETGGFERGEEGACLRAVSTRGPVNIHRHRRFGWP